MPEPTVTLTLSQVQRLARTAYDSGRADGERLRTMELDVERTRLKTLSEVVEDAERLSKKASERDAPRED